jgi:hypothetical protein
MHSYDKITCHDFAGYELVTKAINEYGPVIEMNANKTILV